MLQGLADYRQNGKQYPQKVEAATAQSFGKICIDALVFFFQGNGQRENLAFRQLVEVSSWRD